jgi:hypothetical protein
LTNLFIERYKKNWRKTMVGNNGVNNSGSITGAIGGSSKVSGEAAAAIQKIATTGNTAISAFSPSSAAIQEAALLTQVA